MRLTSTYRGCPRPRSTFLTSLFLDSNQNKSIVAFVSRNSTKCCTCELHLSILWWLKHRTLNSCWKRSGHYKSGLHLGGAGEKGYCPPRLFGRYNCHGHIGGASPPPWISETTILHPLAPLSKCSPNHDCTFSIAK